MSLNEKLILPDKINKLTIKLKSYAFMKIFMIDDQQLKKFHKIRHYDLELEGAAAISSWMKKKLQQVYLRGFLEIKDTQPELVSLRYIQEPSQESPKIEKLHFRNSPVKSTGKFRSQTDRESQAKIKMPSYSTQQLIEKGSMVKVIYRSEYGSENNKKVKKNEQSNRKSEQEEEDRKSNLISLLDKVRKVNTQSRQDKENYQRNETGYNGLSCDNSRVVSSHSVYAVGSNNNNWKQNNNRNNNKSFYAREQQQTARINTVNPNTNNSYNNDLSFCTYGQTERVNSINNLKSMRNHHHCPNPTNIHTQRVSENYTPVTYTISNPQYQEQEEQQMDKSNLMSLKKWNRHQKRNIIMSKINDLEKSLMYADCSTSRQQEDFYYNNNNDEMYTSRDYYEIPANYSQGYLNMRTERLPVRSVVEVRVRK